MRIIKNKTKFMKRYHDDFGYLRRVKLYTKTRLNIISNKIYLLKGELYRLKSPYEPICYRKKRNLKKILKLSYALGSIIYKAKLKKKKINTDKRAKLFMNWLLTNRMFRRVYNNLKKRQLKTLYSNNKGNIKKIQTTLEKRLDIILVRSGLSIDISEARQLINHKIVKINNKIITNYGRILQIGDLVTLDEGKVKAQFIEKRLNLLKSQKEEIIQREIYKKYHRMNTKSSAWALLKVRLKTFTPKAPSYLETSIPLFATTLIYEPRISEITYPFTVLVNPVNKFISGLNLFRRIGK